MVAMFISWKKPPNQMMPMLSQQEQTKLMQCMAYWLHLTPAESLLKQQWKSWEPWV